MARPVDVTTRAWLESWRTAFRWKHAPAAAGATIKFDVVEQRREPSWADFESPDMPDWLARVIAHIELARGWRAWLWRLALAPLLAVSWTIARFSGISGREMKETLIGAGVVGRAGRHLRNGRFSTAQVICLEECRRLRCVGIKGFTSYWLPLHLAGRCALKGSSVEEDEFLAEVDVCPFAVQGRYAADVAHYVSRVYHRRKEYSDAMRWAHVAVKADPTHPEPKEWLEWLETAIR